MIKGESFLELAGLCSRACHVLETVDDLSRFGENIEDLGRCVGSACSLFLTMTSGPRIVSNIESGIRERMNCAIDLPEHLPTAANECVKAWQKELGAILSLFNVRRS